MNISVAVGLLSAREKKMDKLAGGGGGGGEVTFRNRVHGKKDICSLECSPALENK